MSAFLNINDPYTVVPQFPERSPTEVRKGTPATWVRPGQVVNIAGITLRHGNFYLGGILGTTIGDANDNPVINPALVDPNLPAIDYPRHEPPSFACLPIRLKLDYLRWLAGGAVDRHVPVEFPLLYFYGLEHRIMVEGESGPQVLGEVRRLQLLFPHEDRLRRDVARLLMSVGVSNLKDEGRPVPGGGTEVALRPAPDVLIYLGRRISHMGKLDADDAFLWMKSCFRINVGLAGMRCPNEFEVLFKLRFEEAYPDGLNVAMTKPLKLSHRLATWRRVIPLRLPSHGAYVGDVEQVPNLTIKLQYLATRCSDELEAFSRYASRKGVDPRSLEAIALLPDILKRANPKGGYAKVVRALDEAVKKNAYIETDVPRFLGLFDLEVKPTGSVGAKVQTSIAGFLDTVGFGFEPDRRYGNGGLSGGGAICIFKADNGGELDIGAAGYAVARPLVELSVLAAKADGVVNQREMAVVRKFMEQFTALGDVERRRLTAAARALMRSTEIDATYMASFARLPEIVWERAVRLVIDVFKADGVVTVDEMKFLERLFKLRKRPVTEAHAWLHRADAAAKTSESEEGLARVAPFEKPASGVKIPSKAPVAGLEGEQPEVLNHKVVIDRDKLERLKRDTKEVSAILQTIFTDDAVAVDPEITHTVSDKNSFDGLDEKHSSLLRQVLVVGSVSRKEFAAFAEGLSLFPDGAIETINDWAFDRFDDPVLEGEGDVAIVPEMIEGLRKMLEREA